MMQDSPHFYLFSGLGADERIFRKLALSKYEHTFIKWIEPVKNESLEAYAGRLSQQIIHPNPVLLGISFGGMIATELSQQISTHKTIIIASAKNRNELPSYYHWAGLLKLNSLIPDALLLKSGIIADWFFGTAGTTHKQVLKNILAETDPYFFRWAIDAILHWKQMQSPENICHIHGTADRLIPYRNIQNAITIKGGGHLLPLTHAREINHQIQTILE